MQVITHYNKDMLWDFSRFTLLRTKTSKRKSPWVVFFSAVVLVGSPILMITRGFDWKLAVLMGVVVLMDTFILGAYNAAGKNIEKSNPALLSAVNVYRFESRYFEIETANSNEKKDRVFYDQVLKVVKTPRYFYIFLTQTSAYIISREEIVEGEKEDVSDDRKKGNIDDRLAHFLQEKMGAQRYFERLK